MYARDGETRYHAPLLLWPASGLTSRPASRTPPLHNLFRKLITQFKLYYYTVQTSYRIVEALSSSQIQQAWPHFFPCASSFEGEEKKIFKLEYKNTYQRQVLLLKKYTNIIPYAD
jgi:hypothetical protein